MTCTTSEPLRLKGTQYCPNQSYLIMHLQDFELYALNESFIHFTYNCVLNMTTRIENPTPMATPKGKLRKNVARNDTTHTHCMRKKKNMK